MAQIISITALRKTQQMSAEAVRIRARTTARIAGCGRAEILAVDSECAALIAAGETNHQALERCKQLSAHLAAQRRQVSR